MRVFTAALSVAGILSVTFSCFAADMHPHHRSSAHPIVSRSASRASHHIEQHSYERLEISSDRATEIQTALIKQGYLVGDPTGTWDSSSIAAMQKLQSDNGWQTKLVPDSRALIKLGLGPGSEPAAPSALATTPAAAAVATTLAAN